MSASDGSYHRVNFGIGVPSRGNAHILCVRECLDLSTDDGTDATTVSILVRHLRFVKGVKLTGCQQSHTLKMRVNIIVIIIFFYYYKSRQNAILQ